MKLKQANLSEVNGYKKTKLLKILEDFEKSNMQTAELTEWEGEYASASSLQSALKNATQRFHMNNLECKAINKRVYLFNKVLCEKQD